jgi:hypothetical protein
LLVCANGANTGARDSCNCCNAGHYITLFE